METTVIPPRTPPISPDDFFVQQNLGLGVESWGTNADHVMTVANGTAPTTSPADAWQMYSADITAGNAAPHFRTENGDIVKIYKVATYTQNYTTADRTIDNYTADAESSAYSGIDNAQAGTVYAQVSDVNALRTAYENLRAGFEDLLQAYTALLDDLQTLGLIG